MRLFAVAAGLLLLLLVLWDAFETIVLPRRASFRYRLTRLFYRATWPPFAAIGRRMRPGISRENFLSVFGPLSLILLLALWACTLVFGFALLQWGLGSHLSLPPGLEGFGADLYMSGTTFFTLGLGDVTPISTTARALTTVEAGTGFAFLALVIGYLPMLSQTFSRREVPIALLDARAGSPPTATELLRRHAESDMAAALTPLFSDWERWSADILEGHISFPVLAFYRSQHDNQSWVAALTMVLDTCSLVITGIDRTPVGPARLTFAMARHALADLTSVLGQKPLTAAPDRLPASELARLRTALSAVGLSLHAGREAEDRLAHLRSQYEPYAHALARLLLMPLPPWLPPAGARDNWQTTTMQFRVP
ncbi:MAG TPA: potassium channel family protein [Thermoanaerobaculia bacterium]|nr:potassium channel family protein [Thermoanaerobaculia bacterium]